MGDEVECEESPREGLFGEALSSSVEIAIKFPLRQKISGPPERTVATAGSSTRWIVVVMPRA
jgi:hypothetical protein